MLGRLFGRREGEAPAEPAAGPLRAGVAVGPAAAPARLDATPSRGGASLVGPLDGPPPGAGLSWAVLVLSGERVGEVLLSPDGRFDLPPGTLALLDGAAPSAGEGAGAIGRESLAGTPFAGVAGARTVVAGASRAVLRFGPPPAVRWAVVGLRSVAVLAGKLTLFDGETAFDVRPGEAALVAEPSATLHLLAGNDAVVAVAFAAPGARIRLG